MEKIGFFGLTAILVLIAAIPVAAVTNGQPDGDGHPYVGLVVFDDALGHPAWRCSGSLLSPTVFLTAGHCTDGAVAARVWFVPDLTSNTEYPFSGRTSFDGIPYTHPGFAIGSEPGLPGFDTHDVGVVVLTERVPKSVVRTYAQLPSEGLVDTLAMNTEVTLVGYGIQHETAGNLWTALRIRYFAPSLLIASEDVISDEYIKLTANPAQDKGGVCFGDSGGPDLLGDTDTILAVNSFVTNGNCEGVTYSNRIDTYALAFINGFLER